MSTSTALASPGNYPSAPGLVHVGEEESGLSGQRRRRGREGRETNGASVAARSKRVLSSTSSGRQLGWRSCGGNAITGPQTGPVWSKTEAGNPAGGRIWKAKEETAPSARGLPRRPRANVDVQAKERPYHYKGRRRPGRRRGGGRGKAGPHQCLQAAVVGFKGGTHSAWFEACT